jgi:hypothetical protein
MNKSTNKSMNKSNIFRKEALERLSSPEQLDQLMQIVSPRSWLPLTALGGLLACGLVWSFVGRIPVTTTGQGVMVYADLPTGETPSEELLGVAYFNAGEISQIQPGMKVLLIPDVQGQQVAGGLMGRVKSVSTPPATTLEAIRKIDFEQAKIEVVTIPDRDLNGDYHWSTGVSEMTPMAGMPAIARITLQEKAPITFVLPFLENRME